MKNFSRSIELTNPCTTGKIPQYFLVFRQTFTVSLSHYPSGKKKRKKVTKFGTYPKKGVTLY